MIAVTLSDRTVKLSPENEAEAVMLDSWYHRTVAVESRQGSMDGNLTGIVLAFGSER